MLKQTRQALHAGTWYSNNRSPPSYPANELNDELNSYISKAKKELQPKAIKAMIGPHAGYYYSGPTAAWGYQYFTKPHPYKRVFIFGPSHHKYLPGCALSYVDQCATPFGPLQIDTEGN